MGQSIGYMKTLLLKFQLMSGNKVDVNSPEHRNCHPDRVSKYLNMANGDKDFSRSASMNINGKDVTVLVSKYIQGREFDIEDEDNYRMAEELKSRGFYA